MYPTVEGTMRGTTVEGTMRGMTTIVLKTVEGSEEVGAAEVVDLRLVDSTIVEDFEAVEEEEGVVALLEDDFLRKLIMILIREVVISTTVAVAEEVFNQEIRVHFHLTM